MRQGPAGVAGLFDWREVGFPKDGVRFGHEYRGGIVQQADGR